MKTGTENREWMANIFTDQANETICLIARFSLTPALSRWERESPSPAYRVSCDCVGGTTVLKSKTVRWPFPLPAGEGKGEGEWFEDQTCNVTND